MATASILPAIIARLSVALARPARRCRPLVVDGAPLGWLDDDRAARVARFGDVFDVDERGIRFASRLRAEADRTRAMADVARALAAEGRLTAWRDERYAVAPRFGAPAAFLLERAAARFFGVCTYAAHVNGFTRRNGALALWFARRSPTKAIDPGHLDNLVGGGIAADGPVALLGDPVHATLVKEAWEEAGIAADVAARAHRTGAVTICREQPDGLQRETIFVHDLELPPGFEPRNQDGEAVEHRCVPLDEAARLISVASGADVVTADASLVVLDFLLRHGTLAAQAPQRVALEALLAAPLALG